MALLTSLISLREIGRKYRIYIGGWHSRVEKFLYRRHQTYCRRGALLKWRVISINDGGREQAANGLKMRVCDVNDEANAWRARRYGAFRHRLNGILTFLEILTVILKGQGDK